MKYIRTKDGIWLFGGTHFKGDVIIGKKQEIDFGFCFDKKDAIKQADTIEALCDEFVIYDADIKKCYILEKGFYHRFDEECKKALHLADRYIYGAIWTEWGLKYVAKMNDNGELCLL